MVCDKILRSGVAKKVPSGKGVSYLLDNNNLFRAILVEFMQYQ